VKLKRSHAVSEKVVAFSILGWPW